MKFRAFFKHPEAIENGIADAMSDICFSEYDDPEAEESAVEDQCRKAAEPFLKYGEMIVIEFDTVAKTATVVRQS